MEKQERQFIPGLSVLLLAALLLGFIGALLHDSREVAFGKYGALFWAGALVVTFLLGTIYLSRNLLPVQGNQGWSDGFRLLARNYLLGMTDLINGQRRVPLAKSTLKKKSSTSELPLSFSIVRAGFLLSHEAVAITRGNTYARADGPGLVFLRSGESIAGVFDLRPQSRRLPVNATTRDGIPVSTTVSVSFRVRQRSPHERRARSIEMDDIPYRYDRDALFELNYANSIHGDEKRDWTEQVCPQAATLLVSEIGKYTLDQLLAAGASEPMKNIRDNIVSALKAQQLGEELQSLPGGLEITGVGIGPLKLPEMVTAKRVATWQVEWQNRATQQLVRGDIARQRLVHQARAQAQVENIENLLLSIEALREQSQNELHEVIMRRLVEVLESMTASRSLARPAAPAALLDLITDTSSEIREIMDRSEE